MGSLHRFAFCASCNIRLGRFGQGEKPSACPACGSQEHRFSDWYIRFYVLGVCKEEKAGNLDMARRALIKRESEVKEGKFRLVAERRILLGAFAQDDYWRLYCERQLSETTRTDYKNRIKQRILPAFGDLYLSRISQREIEEWLAVQHEEGLAPATVIRNFNLLRSIFSAAVRLKIIETNPCHGIRLARPNNRRVRFLSIEEYKILQENANSMLRAAIALAIGTGLRRANLFNLKWSDIDLKNGIITIPANLSKSKRQISVPIISPVTETLQALPRALHCDYVLVKPRTGGKYRDMRTAFERLLEKVDLEGVTWHTLRHTFASWHAQAGTDLFTIQQLMGLNSYAMVQRYAHLSPEHKAKKAKNIEGFFENKKEKERRPYVPEK